jgi:8-oxo-dGTP pyrophosphatase MutT (NUDIX family)
VRERSDRPSARVIVVDETGSVLLFRILDPSDPGPPVWVTPGGGIEPGESLVEAASRELREETGVAVDVDNLGAPVAVCRGEWEFRGVPLYSEDSFFAVRIARFEPSTDGWEALEREVHHSWRWWTPDELDRADEAVLPARLADVVRGITRGDLGPGPLELPWRVV